MCPGPSSSKGFLESKWQHEARHTHFEKAPQGPVSTPLPPQLRTTACEKDVQVDKTTMS